MKTHRSLYTLLAGSLLLISSCEQPDLPQYAAYSAYEFATLDEDGGSWQPILLTDPEQITVDAPAAVQSVAYQQELADLHATMANLSDAQRNAVTYWTNNPVVRWNEIALELIAKYNLIPGPNADGTYTLPNLASPEGPSPFPFAHPPYAVRALAYLSVAQWDGLITAWHYKYTYQRPAPAQVDPTLHSAYATTALPAYPSEGAVVAVVSQAVLSAMFPLEKEYLRAKAQEHLESLRWAGVNVASDITAGQHIGTEIATLALERAATDGMKFAQCSRAVSDSIAQAAFDRFGWKWENIEEPARPVGLAPLLCNVKMWNVPHVTDVRPGPPPAPGSAEYEANIRELIDIADHLTVEQRRIANFWQDGLGTYTPPGHWNKIAKDFVLQYRLNPLRTARTFAYLNEAMMDAGVACWDAKYYYHYPRPIQQIPGFKTIAGTPNFPSYTSGHSVFSAAGAEVLAYLFPPEADKVRNWALEAAISRVYGGIHYRFDAEVGTDMGIETADYTLAKARTDGAD
ncbi:PAP2 superfamily protein [Catalinimonas alkaloidigena]|uniref:PAP2 superfamily protein n=1 Tax=Catalinimonas alkaloidigena TaxID=1075417 RepID=A0A1G9KBT8_9BACT|nr:phosphatase PAP2 family protein [Catalinimonas alkaloidigena]SDL47390.1 PAP2 superfamily protein [Catalinimonas alkaloidigena]